MHLQDPTEALSLVLSRVVDVGTSVDLPRVDPEEGEPSDIWVGRDLEGEGREGRLIGSLPRHDSLILVRGVTLDRGDIEWGGQVVDHAIDQLGDALVLEGRPTEDGDDPTGECRHPDRSPDLITGELLTLEVELHQLIVVLDRGLDQLFPSSEERRVGKERSPPGHMSQSESHAESNET